jgi:hypothetical protein
MNFLVYAVYTKIFNFSDLVQLMRWQQGVISSKKYKNIQFIDKFEEFINFIATKSSKSKVENSVPHPA